MSFEKSGTLFIFFDESGNFDFSNSGTRFWSLGALCTYNPIEGRDEFLRLGYCLAEDGRGQECFHATEDKQDVRDRVFGLITAIPKVFDVHFSVAEKRKVPPALRKDPVSFYSYMCRKALRYIVTLDKYRSAQKLVIIFSSIFNKPKHQALLGELKAEFKEILSVPFHIYFKCNQQDINCQIADYCCWAMYIKWDRNDERSYALIKGKISSEESLFPSNGRDYY